MSNEEFERTMAFIVQQQAQFSVDIQRLQEAQTQTEQIVVKTAQTVAETGEIVARLANVTLEGFKDVNAKIDSLVDSQIRSDEKLAASQTLTDERFAALADSQIRSDEKLRNLITVVDRYITEGRNGG